MCRFLSGRQASAPQPPEGNTPREQEMGGVPPADEKLVPQSCRLVAAGLGEGDRLGVWRQEASLPLSSAASADGEGGSAGM